MSKCVVLLEDEPDLAQLVRELLEDEGYALFHSTTVEELLREAAARSPCVALIDGLSPTGFNLWWVGPKLSQLGVPAVAFTAHASALAEFAADPHGFVGVIGKPFDANEFLDLVNSICWEDHKAAS
jgi:two-component system, NtrC family, nitrogen regulation response regulator NtrX